jgi:hypothetical protein
MLIQLLLVVEYRLFVPLKVFNEKERCVRLANITQFLRKDMNAHLQDMVQDSIRFILYHGSTIEQTPLQAYASALVFSPKTSLIRQQFLDQGPTWIDQMAAS